MRILHTIPGLNWGGMEFRVLEQIAWLNAHGHQAWLATPKGGESFKRASAQGLPLIDVDFDRPWHLNTIRQMRALIRDLEIEVVDAHVTRDAKVLMLCRDLVAVVRSRHITQRLKPGAMRSLQWRWGADAVIAVADCIAKSMIADGLVDPERTWVVGEWADDFFFTQPSELVRQGLRNEFGIQTNQTVIVCVGMFRPDKGQDILINALAHLPDSYIVMMIGAATGEGDDYGQALLTLAREQGVTDRIRWTGYRNDIPNLLGASELVAVPSRLEAQSRVVPQAFAAGKPVVATKVGGLPELVQDGKTGLLVPPGDPLSLARAIEKLATDTDLANRLAGNAKAFAIAELRMDRQMEATLSIYGKALERGRRRPYLSLRGL
ncbi:MAG: glycosyltransferase family 4 protein [Alphaproteobacteria bacterium]|nr:glycosyltransferase family 4 protein [Alphaproteobacteria bacterium]